jgi:hypothetical protein
MQTGALGIATSTGSALNALFTIASPDPVGAAFGQAVAWFAISVPPLRG